MKHWLARASIPLPAKEARQGAKVARGLGGGAGEGLIKEALIKKVRRLPEWRVH
jgi:hypothetical protein